MTNNLK